MDVVKNATKLEEQINCLAVYRLIIILSIITDET
jgi:hypothetical protein